MVLYMIGGPVLDDFVNWCDQYFLQINVCNTKKLYIDWFSEESLSTCTRYDLRGSSGSSATVQDLGTVLYDKMNFDATLRV